MRRTVSLTSRLRPGKLGTERCIPRLVLILSGDGLGGVGACPACPPTAVSKAQERSPGSGPHGRPAGNAPPSCSPRVTRRPGVAGELDVSRQSTSRWHAGWQADGIAALRSRGPTSRRPSIPDSALEPIEQAPLEGQRLNTVMRSSVHTSVGTRAPAHGRAAVESVGVAIASRSLGWSVQRPEHQAKERDEQARTHNCAPIDPVTSPSTVGDDLRKRPSAQRFRVGC